MGLMDSVGNFLQGDFVKNGVREMMIARPEGNTDLVYKHPDRTIPMFAQVTIRPDEVGVFSKDGRPAGMLPPGRHTLSTQNIPFLANFIDQYTGGNFLITELYFVNTYPKEEKYGGSLGNMIDPSTSLRVRPRCHGAMLIRVENPEAMIYQYFGMGMAQQHASPLDWFKDAFFSHVKTTIGKVAKDQNRPIFDVMDMQDELCQAFVTNSADLAQTGIRIVRVTQFEADFPDEDLKRIDEMRQKVAEMRVGLQVDEIAIQRAALQAQAEAARAQVAVQTAQYAAQANQFALDQKRAQDAAYVQMAGGDINRLGQFEAMRGAGSGLAQGGGNTGLAGMGAQIAVGSALGSNLAAGVVPGGGGGVAPGGASMVIGGAGVGMALLACPQCQAQVPPGKFCAECGGPLAAPKKHCAQCGVELLANAKFCPECGTPAVAVAAPQQPPRLPYQPLWPRAGENHPRAVRSHRLWPVKTPERYPSPRTTVRGPTGAVPRSHSRHCGPAQKTRSCD